MTSIFGAGFAPAYATSKGGIVQLTKSLALAWAADNIQVNAILPGWFDTELTEKAREQIPGLHERVLARIAAGPMGQAGRHGGDRHLARQPGQRLRHRHRRPGRRRLYLDVVSVGSSVDVVPRAIQRYRRAAVGMLHVLDGHELGDQGLSAQARWISRPQACPGLMPTRTWACHPSSASVLGVSLLTSFARYSADFVARSAECGFRLGVADDPAEDLDLELPVEREPQRDGLDRHEELQADRSGWRHGTRRGWPGASRSC